MKPILGPILYRFADDVVVGDLLEEFREERVPKVGRMRAEIWYARQIISIIWHGIPSGLLILCLLSSLCAGWLCLMELRLQHRGFVSRSYMDSLFLVQALLAPLAVPAQRSAGWLRSITYALTGLVLIYAVAAVYGDLSNPHFEGYALVAGILFIMQSVATYIALIRKNPESPVRVLWKVCSRRLRKF